MQTVEAKFGPHTGYVASLPWYDGVKSGPGLDKFWSAARGCLHNKGIHDVPLNLTRNESLATLWSSPRLLLSQCCSPDLDSAEGAELQVIARPVFAALNCRAGYYYSHVVCRTGYPQNGVVAVVNSLSSWSGYFSLLGWMKERRIEASKFLVSGSHANSVAMLNNGCADIAAIDAQSVERLGLNIAFAFMDRTREAPAPPYVMHRECKVQRDVIFEALTHAVDQEGHSVGVSGLV